LSVVRGSVPEVEPETGYGRTAARSTGEYIEQHLAGKRPRPRVTVGHRSDAFPVVLQATLNWGKKDEPVYVTEESGVVGLNFHQSKEVLAQDQTNGVSVNNGKLPEMQMMEPQYDSSCCELTTRGKTKALLQKNFLRMWRNVG